MYINNSSSAGRGLGCVRREETWIVWHLATGRGEMERWKRGERREIDERL